MMENGEGSVAFWVAQAVGLSLSKDGRSPQIAAVRAELVEA
jgi:hypothetical protein